MERKTESSTKEETFLTRFRDLFNEKRCSQVQLANAIGSKRGTVATWLDGKTVPNAYMVKAIAEYFNVSADYLLCISDARSSDVNVKAAMEYTGLSEEAVEHLHAGLDYPGRYEIQHSDIEKKEYLKFTSELITNIEFKHMISSLSEAAKWAYLEIAFLSLGQQRSEADMMAGKTKSEALSEEDQDRITAELLEVLGAEGFVIPDYKLSRLRTRVDECLGENNLWGILNVRETLDRQQFLVTKAIMGYLDQLVKESRKRARQRFEK